MEHTPLPWKANMVANQPRMGYEVTTLHGEAVASFLGEANAAYIVKAANLYPELVEALRAFLDISYDTESDEYTEIQVAYANAWAILQRIEQ